VKYVRHDFIGEPFCAENVNAMRYLRRRDSECIFHDQFISSIRIQ
jgi:hypothetical protein